NETGLSVVVDPISGGGPYAYVVFASTPGATGSRNPQHDTAGVIGLVKYGASGTMLSTRTLAIDTQGGMVRDDSGNIFVQEVDRTLGPNSHWITKYNPSLGPMITRVVSSANPAGFGAILSTGTSIFALVQDGNDNTAKIFQYDTNLVAVATSAAYDLGSQPLLGRSMAREKFNGFLFVLVSSASATAPVHMLRYGTNALSLNGATPAPDIINPDLTTQDEARVAVAGGNLYIAFSPPGSNSVIVREYSQSFGYMGFSSTITNVTTPFGKPSFAIDADGANVYVAATVNTGGGGDYLVMKYDANNHLALISSAAFNSSTNMTDQVRAMAIGLPGDVYVTGASSNTAANANVVSLNFQMGAAGGAAGAMSSAAYTSVSTISFIANWNTSFVNGTVYDLQITTNAFSSINYNVTTTNVNFAFGGLLPATTYQVRVSTTGGAGPFMQLDVVATLSTGTSISGNLTYAGLEFGSIRVEAFTNSASTGVPAATQILPNVSAQP
ncbi:MAG: hypothetical protein ABL955_14280, partial [Elusimicrobiota bacterium]